MKKLGFGFMRLPLLDEDATHVDLDQVKQMVDVFMKKGFTYFDTAYVYHNGQSEKFLKQALVERYPRDSFTVATKLALFNPNVDKVKQEAMFNEQLNNLGVSYIDYYLIHNINKERVPLIDKLDSFNFLKQKKAEGKIKHLGFSFHDKPELLEEVLKKHPETDFVQLQINYIDWLNPVVESKACYEIAKKYHKPVVVMEPIKGGTLVNLPPKAADILKRKNPDASLASWAIRFAASLDDVFMVLSGMSTLKQVEDNTSYMENFIPLTIEEHQTLDSIVSIINDSIAIPCTSCGYCLKGCPKHIAIPKYFSLYNNEKMFPAQGFSTQQMYYENLTKDYGKASECIRCGLCEKACPQHLQIRDLLKLIAKEFE